ncbi:MAG: hypothetical protein ACI35P_16045 [Bacillus sp. (in: firmicutes)]
MAKRFSMFFQFLLFLCVTIPLVLVICLFCFGDEKKIDLGVNRNGVSSMYELIKGVLKEDLDEDVNEFFVGDKEDVPKDIEGGDDVAEKK